MPADTIKLDYDLTASEQSMISLRNSRLARTMFAMSYLSLAVLSASGPIWWLSPLYFAVAVAVWLAPRWSVWLAKQFPSLAKEPTPVEILVDQTGLRVRNPSVLKVSPVRYWWSRLAEIREDRFGVTLLYDKHWLRLVIPWGAFADSDQESHFLAIARQHLAPAAPRNKHLLSGGVFRKAS